MMRRALGYAAYVLGGSAVLAAGYVAGMVFRAVAS